MHQQNYTRTYFWTLFITRLGRSIAEAEANDRVGPLECVLDFESLRNLDHINPTKPENTSLLLWLSGTSNVKENGALGEQIKGPENPTCVVGCNFINIESPGEIRMCICLCVHACVCVFVWRWLWCWWW